MCPGDILGWDESGVDATELCVIKHVEELSPELQLWRLIACTSEHMGETEVLENRHIPVVQTRPPHIISRCIPEGARRLQYERVGIEILEHSPLATVEVGGRD